MAVADFFPRMAIDTNLDRVPPLFMEYRLPSGGITYGGDVGRTVRITPFSFQTERYMMTNATVDAKLAHVAHTVAELPAHVPFGKLLMGDVLTILSIARGLTYGETYNFNTTCPKCGEDESVVIRVPADVPVTVWEDEDEEALNQRLEVVLPHCKDRVGIRYPSVDDQAEIRAAARTTEAAAAGSSSMEEEIYMATNAFYVREVNGGRPDSLAEAKTYIARLRGRDKVALEKMVDDNNPGIRFTYDIECPACTHRYETTVPIRAGFFR